MLKGKLMNQTLKLFGNATKANSRGWIAVGCYSLVLIVLCMIMLDPKILNNDAFLVLATAIVITGWVQGPVGWAYQATQTGSEIVASHARIAEQAAGVPNYIPKDAEQAAEQVAGAADQVRDEIVQAAENQHD